MPTLVRDVRTGLDKLGTRKPEPSDIQEYVQPDTQIEPSVAVNPANPRNVVAVYQEGRIADGGDATNGYATSFDGGKTWRFGELPKLTTFPGQGGVFERASDAVVAFGPNNTVYANSLVFDFNTGGGLRSGIAVNVSKNGGKTWSNPVILQDDQLGGTNDKNWIVVDDSSAPGHHKGRVYVVWDRVAPVVYDYCDHDCDKLANWLPDLQTLSPVVFPGQGIGAYPMVMKNGGLGIVIDTISGGVPTGPDEPEVPPGTTNHVLIAAPNAGSTPYPLPLAFEPPIQITANRSNGIRAQRASDGLPAAAVDPKSGALYAVFDDGRFRTDQANDALISRSTDNGATWSAPKKVNPGKPNDGIDHYNVTVAVGTDGRVHVAYRQRNESRNPPLFSPTIDTFYQESRDGGKTFSAPLKVDVKPSHAYYDAFSRDGSFEGDYNETVSSGGYTYITRAQGTPLYRGEPPALTKNPDGSDTVVLKNSGKGHQHQRNWVALVRDLAAGRGPCVGSSSLRTRIRHVHVADGHLTIRGTARDLGCAVGIRRVEVAVAKHVGRHRCRFASSDGTLGPAVKCSHRHFVRARGTSSWSLALPGELRRGHYVLWARARGALRRGAAARRTFVVR
ncbi:MAG: hypothetical protein E6G53_12090 [Actinobacteria bacterium]|nr:MAG: hypothetical protein E6G53_12090 [Actinomycetota bacterium]